MARRRPVSRPTGRRHWPAPGQRTFNFKLDDLTRCQRCAGKGRYKTLRDGEYLTVECKVCNGTGRVPLR